LLLSMDAKIQCSYFLGCCVTSLEAGKKDAEDTASVAQSKL